MARHTNSEASWKGSRNNPCTCETPSVSIRGVYNDQQVTCSAQSEQYVPKETTASIQLTVEQERAMTAQFLARNAWAFQ